MNQAIPVLSQLTAPGELVTELSLGNAQGGRRQKLPLTIEFVRALTPDDLPAIQNPPEGTAAVPMVRELRSSHHRLAELVAAGRAPEEISIITGYSPGYISGLKGDPAFRELVAYYEFQKREIFADAMERLKALGLDAAEKLHERLNDPEKIWSNKELMELVKMTIAEPEAAKKQAPGPGGSFNTANLNLEVRFVGARPSDGPTINAEFTEAKGQ